MAPPAPVVLAGVITSAKSQVVAAEFEGRVEDVLVRGGQRVTASQVLARLDDSQLRQRVESARQAANAARAEAARASIGVAEARAKLARWNEDNPESPIRIKMQQIITRAKKLREDRASRFITSVSPERRRAVAEALE